MRCGLREKIIYCDIPTRGRSICNIFPHAHAPARIRCIAAPSRCMASAICRYHRTTPHTSKLERHCPLISAHVLILYKK